MSEKQRSSAEYGGVKPPIELTEDQARFFLQNGLATAEAASVPPESQPAHDSNCRLLQAILQGEPIETALPENGHTRTSLQRSTLIATTLRWGLEWATETDGQNIEPPNEEASAEDFVALPPPAAVLQERSDDLRLPPPRQEVRANPFVSSSDAFGRLSDSYNSNLAKVPLLKAEEEVELAKRIEAGVFATERLRQAEAAGELLDPTLRRDLRWIVRDGKQAENHLLEANLRLVKSHAKKFLGLGLERSELEQEGYFGLRLALEKFNYKLGYKFSTYATWWIRQALFRALADQSRLIRLPVTVHDKIRQLKTEIRELEKRGQEPTIEQIAEKMDIPPEKVAELQQHMGLPVSLDTPVGEGEKPLGDFIVEEGADSASAERLSLIAERSRQVERLLGILDERSALIVRLRSSGKTLEEVGQLIGRTKERVRQVEKIAMDKLREYAPSALADLVDLD